MPAGFDRCRAAKGRIVTVTGPSKRYGLKTGEYKHICIKSGEFHQGEVKKKR